MYCLLANLYYSEVVVICASLVPPSIHQYLCDKNKLKRDLWASEYRICVCMDEM